MIGNEGRGTIRDILLGDVKTVVIRHRKHGRRVWSRRKFPKTVIVTIWYIIRVHCTHAPTHTPKHTHTHLDGS